MKYFFYILFLMSSISCFSQDTLCRIKIVDTTHSFGIRFKIHTPCTWFKGPQDRNVVKYAYRTKDTAFMFMLSVKDLGAVLTKKDIDLLFTEKYIQKEGFQTGIIRGELVSIKRGKINGSEGGEMVIKDCSIKNNIKFCTYLLQCIIIYEDKEIIVTYGVAAEDEKMAKESFEKYKESFRAWAHKIEFTDDKFNIHF